MENSSIRTHKDLIVWQKAMKLVVHIYDITEKFPTDERYGLSSQMQRAAVSIPSNIAEGKRRGTRKDFAYFLSVAYGSGSELETQIEIVKTLPKFNHVAVKQAEQLLNEILKMLNVMIAKLKS